MKFKFLILFCTVFFNIYSSSYSSNFNNFSELRDCVDTYYKYEMFLNNLQKCFDKKNIKVDKKVYRIIDNRTGIIDDIVDLNIEGFNKKKDLGDILDNIFSPEFKKKADDDIFDRPTALSENYLKNYKEKIEVNNIQKNKIDLTNNDFVKLNNHIRNNPKDIFALTEDINRLALDENYISEFKRQEAMLNLYNSFNPLDLNIIFNSNPPVMNNPIALVGLAGAVALGAGGGGGGGGSGGSSGPATISYSKSSSSISECGTSITFTANLTKAHTSNVSITYSTGGTATDGVDYNLSSTSSTIVAGGTSASITLSPVNDTTNEISETVIVTASTTDVSSTGNTSTTITIHDYVLACNSTAYSEDTSVQNTIINRSSWTEVDKSGNNLHPYELTNLHKAHSYKNGSGQFLTGEGETIFIIDDKFTPAHETYNNKTVTVIDTTTPSTTSFNHGDHVASIAAGDINGTTQGVAPDADLVLASFDTSSIANLATDLDTARTNHAPIVVNNSWGIQQNCNGLGVCTSALEFDEVKTAASNNGVTFRDQMANNWGSSSAVSSFITALDNFQNNGVVVWASSNYVNDNDVGVEGGLPAYFDGVQDSVDLSDAWISVMYADFTGSSLTGASTSDFTRRGNPCGNAKEWCLVVDDFDINAASHVDAGGTSQYTRLSGSSMGAPQVSGMIALLGQAFPNHTPEQLTDRLLASANNAWFTPTGNTTFTTHGASIQHGYNDEWGHGVPDVYAALSPITTSKNPLSFGGGGGSGGGGSGGGGSGQALPFANITKHSVHETKLSTSNSIGDAIYKSLNNKKVYAYDALNGGFELNLSNFIEFESFETQIISTTFEEEFNILRNKKFDKVKVNETNFEGEFLSFKDKYDRGISITLDSNSIANQNFNKQGNNFYKNPFTSENEGIGLNNKLFVFGNELLISYNNSKVNPLTNINKNIILPLENLSMSINLKNDKIELFKITAGLMREESSFLLSKPEGAFSLDDKGSLSNYYGINLSKTINEFGNIYLNSMLSSTSIKSNSNSMLINASEILSSNFEIGFKKENLYKSDVLNLSFSQPNKVENGNMSFRLLGLADKNGIIPFEDHIINLSPSGRQKDLVLSYYKNFDTGLKVGLKTIVTDDLGHIKDKNLRTNILATISLGF